jgi:hypothetical protein
LRISSSGLTLNLSTIQTEGLKPHEEVIEEAVKKLTDEIRRDGVVRDPLIVDEASRVILDGTHRFTALKRLGCRFIPCCLLDYMNPQISVGSWFRALTVESPNSIAENVLSNLKLDYSKNPFPNDKYGPNAIILTKDANEFSLRTSDTLARCRIAAAIEKGIVNDSHKVTYLSELLAMQWLRSDRANFVIALPPFTKEIIREYGSAGVLFPHKVTRHVIPSRPLAIDVPVDLLTDIRVSDQEVSEGFDKLLAGRKLDRRPPGSVINGRRYDEELLVFSP